MEYSIPESRAVRTEQAAKALRMIEDAIVESVQAAGELGAPGGIKWFWRGRQVLFTSPMIHAHLNALLTLTYNRLEDAFQKAEYEGMSDYV